MLDWIYIHDNYPQSYELLMEFWTIGNCGEPDKHKENEDPWNDRNLYDFFDSEGIFIVIDIELKDDIYYDLHVKWIGFIQNDEFYKTRLDAEEAAYINAFQLLENKLTQQK